MVGHQPVDMKDFTNRNSTQKVDIRLFLQLQAGSTKSKYVITGLNEAQIDSLVRNRASFEINGLRGNFMAGIKLVETKIESLGMKCRVKSDTKSALAQGGAIGAIASLASVPVTLSVVTLTAAASAGHNLLTRNPDYEILKDYVNQRLRVIYKK
mgnify:CR=1 FL=1